MNVSHVDSRERSIQRQRASGFALIFGSVGFLLTMALHPTAGSVEGLVRGSAVTIGSHSLGLAMIPVLFFGMVGVTERLQGAPVWAPTALVTFGFGSVAAMCAGVLNGLVAPGFAARVISQTALHDTARVVLTYGFQANAAFAKVFMVAVSAALVMWARAVVQTDALPRSIGVLAGVLGGVGLVAIFGGYLGTGVHEFGLFVLCLVAWTVSVGVILLRTSQRARTD